MIRPTLIVLAKAPRMGRAKTRLACGIGQTAALRFYRATLARTLRVLGHDPRWDKVLAVAPDGALAGWPREWRVVPQGGGDLGARMLRQLAAVSGPAILIGGDIPGVTSTAIGRAFSQLRRHDVVFGPAEDGGYWLIGTRRPPRSVRALAGVRWSTAHALADSVAALGLRAGFADILPDVDDATDYKRYIRRSDKVSMTLVQPTADVP